MSHSGKARLNPPIYPIGMYSWVVLPPEWMLFLFSAYDCVYFYFSQATLKINNYLGGLNFSGYFDLSNSPINIQKGLNSFSHHVSIDYKNERYSLPAINPQMQIINSCGNHCNIPTLTTSPFYNCSCNNGSGSPHEILIKNALNL